MGHIAYLRKQFNSINTYDYHNVNWEKKHPIIYIMWIEWFFTWTISLKDALHQIWLKLAQWFGRKCEDNNDDDGQRTNLDQKSLLEPSAHVSLKSIIDTGKRSTPPLAKKCTTC